MLIFKNIYGRRLFILTVLIAGTLSMRAERPKISARLSSPVMEMGDKISLDIQVVSDRGSKGGFPIFNGVSPSGFATLLGDTIELGANYSASSIDLGRGRMQTDYKIPVQVFDSGFYTIPPIGYVNGRDTVFTEPLTLKVVPVVAQASDEISDFSDVLPPGKGSFYDSLPLWILEWWWALLTIALLIVGTILFLMRYQRVKLRRPAKLLPPYEEAMRDLERLKENQLWQSGETKEYYTRLVDILRRYISRRFKLHAMEMTTDQILSNVRKHDRLKPYLDRFRTVLGVADFAKFANMPASPEENTKAFAEVREFVESTRPTSEEIKVEADKEKKEASKTPKAKWERRPSKGNPKKRKETKI